MGGDLGDSELLHGHRPAPYLVNQSGAWWPRPHQLPLWRCSIRGHAPYMETLPGVQAPLLLPDWRHVSVWVDKILSDVSLQQNLQYTQKVALFSTLAE